MPKIISIEENVVKIGKNNGDIVNVSRTDVNFPEPRIGDEVEIYENKETNEIIVSKAAESKGYNNSGGNNIIIDNSHNSHNDGNVYSSNYRGSVVPLDPPPTQGNVNKIVYCLLAFFLGWCGAHKFYANKISAGICYIIFCWTFIPAFIAFIEFIVALCKESDAYGNIYV